MIIIVGGGIVVGAAILFFLATYTVVDPNEAHVVVFMGRGRKVYSVVGEGNERSKTSYFFIPLLMKRQVLPLTNVRMAIDEIHLNDKNVAPFICDVISWLHIQDPIKAAERLDFNHSEGVFGSLREDLINVVQSVARAVAMEREVLEIMKNRKTLSESLSKDVDDVLQSWGIDLVNLEVNDIRDDSEKRSTVIHDYETMRRAEIASMARKQIAEKDREAVESEQENLRKSEIAKAVSLEAATKRNIEREEVIGVSEMERDKKIAMKKKEANLEQVDAEKTLVVGQARNRKEATIEVATGDAEAIRIKGEKDANVVKLKGEAEGSAITARGLAEAEAKSKMADALQKFNDAATNIEKIHAWVEVQKAFAEAQGKVAENAEIKVVNSGKGGNIFGLPLNAETGADLGQMLEGLDLSKLADLLKVNKKA